LELEKWAKAIMEEVASRKHRETLEEIILAEVKNWVSDLG
jgi:hypothetical protein